MYGIGWNEICGTEGLPPGHRGRREKSHPAEEDWLTAAGTSRADILEWRAEYVLEVPLPRGEQGGWKVTLGWLVDNDRNCLKVYEGNYNGEAR